MHIWYSTIVYSKYTNYRTIKLQFNVKIWHLNVGILHYNVTVCWYDLVINLKISCYDMIVSI